MTALTPTEKREINRAEQRADLEEYDVSPPTPTAHQMLAPCVLFFEFLRAEPAFPPANRPDERAIDFEDVAHIRHSLTEAELDDISLQDAALVRARASL